jgi:hypothetical protein
MLKKLPYYPAAGAYRAAGLVVHPALHREEEAYYRAVFCMIDHDDSRQFLHDMQNIVEGEILTTRCIKPITCRRWGSGCWTPGASSARRNSRRCVRTSSAVARYCAKNSRGNHPDGWRNRSISPASNKIVLLMTGSLSQNIRSSRATVRRFFCGEYDKK